MGVMSQLYAQDQAALAARERDMYGDEEEREVTLNPAFFNRAASILRGDEDEDADEPQARARDDIKADVEDAMNRCYMGTGSTADWLLVCWAAGVDARCLIGR